MARPLRDVFTDLTGDQSAAGADPAALLQEGGHGDLPANLVSEAVASFADTAPPAVAEHLAPFVTAYRAILDDAVGEVANWVDLLASAPPPDEAEIDEIEETVGAADVIAGADPVESLGAAVLDDPLDLDFGAGGSAVFGTAPEHGAGEHGAVTAGAAPDDGVHFGEAPDGVVTDGAAPGVESHGPAAFHADDADDDDDLPDDPADVF